MRDFLDVFPDDLPGLHPEREIYFLFSIDDYLGVLEKRVGA